MANALQTILSNGKIVGYVRVSSAAQSTERQLDGIRLDKVFEDKASGKNAERPALQACLDYLREDDTLVVHSMDRLGRNLSDLLSIVQMLVDRGVTVRFVKENLTFQTGTDSIFDRLLLSILGAFAEFERSMILERQKEGIEMAKKRKAYKGRKPAIRGMKVKRLERLLEQGVTQAEIAAELGVSRQTVYKYLKEKGDAVQSRS